MTHRTDLHRRREASLRRMSSLSNVQSQESVLLDTDNLFEAHRLASDAGKQKIDGLYYEGGRRMSQVRARMQDLQVQSPEILKDQNVSKISKLYQARKQERLKKCTKAKKSEEDLDDEESAKRAKAILADASDHERVLFNQLFDFFDVDKDRNWGSIEFAQRMTDIGCSTSVESAANLLYFAGVRDVDRITFNDFIQMMPKLKAFRVLLEKDAMRAFAERDVRGTGYLSRRALREVINELAGPGGMDDDQVHRLVRRADRERTGRIPFHFFIRALFGTHPVVVYKPKPKQTSFLATLFGCGSSAGQYHDRHDEEEEHRF